MTITNWHKMMDINVLALCLCTKLAVSSMRDRGVDDGQVIHISRYSLHYYIDIITLTVFYFVFIVCWVT